MYKKSRVQSPPTPKTDWCLGLMIKSYWEPFFQSTWHYFIGNPCHINMLLIFWVNLFKTQNKLISHSTTWIKLTWPARSLLQDADSKSNLLFINWDHNPWYHQLIWIRFKQWIKAHDSYYISYTHGKRLLQQEPIFTQNNNKTWGTSSYLWLMIQTYKSLRETLEVVIWRAKRYVKKSSSDLKLIKETCCLQCLLQLPKLWRVHV